MLHTNTSERIELIMVEKMRIAVIGAGIAGLSVGYELSNKYEVIIVEREFQPAYHATGRSSSISEVSYGGGAVNIATLKSQPFFLNPPKVISTQPFAKVIGELYLGSHEKELALRKYAQNTMTLVPEAELIIGDKIKELNPIIQTEKFFGAVFDPSVLSLDVGRLVESLSKAIRHNGGRFVLNCEIKEIEFFENYVSITGKDEKFEVDLVVNASGAWADELASLSGIQKLGLKPLRRTAVSVSMPDALKNQNWPMIAEIDDEYYFKQDGTTMLLCPSDETPSEPCDAQPEPIDIATAIQYFSDVCGQRVERVLSKWAGLRTFSKDRIPVIGADANEERFFWCAAQGGYGVQTSPVLAKMLYQQISGSPNKETEGVKWADFSPLRF
jgi:D-arginine dehydrogenase